MKRLAIAMTAFLAFVNASAAQQNPSEAPATKQEVQKYLELTRSRENMSKFMDVFINQMHQETHQEYLKNKDKLPPDFEAQENRKFEEWVKAFPFDEILQTMVPIYQKHLTKADVDALIAFYSSPTGKKLTAEGPAMAAEAWQAMQPIMLKKLSTAMEQMHQDVAQLSKDSKPTSDRD